jgi:hypothetical protein
LIYLLALLQREDKKDTMQNKKQKEKKLGNLGNRLHTRPSVKALGGCLSASDNMRPGRAMSAVFYE